jgi:hypothetical protein
MDVFFGQHKPTRHAVFCIVVPFLWMWYNLTWGKSQGQVKQAPYHSSAPSSTDSRHRGTDTSVTASAAAEPLAETVADPRTARGRFWQGYGDQQLAGGKRVTDVWLDALHVDPLPTLLAWHDPVLQYFVRRDPLGQLSRSLESPSEPRISVACIGPGGCPIGE